MLHNFDSKEYTLSPKKKLFVTWDEIAILNPWWIQLTVHPSNNNNNSTPVVNSADFHQISRSLLFYILSKKKKKKKERGEIARGISSHLGNLTRDKGIARPPTGSDGGGWSTLKPGPSISALVRWVFILSASRPVMHLNAPFSFLPSFLFFPSTSTSSPRRLILIIFPSPPPSRSVRANFHGESDGSIKFKSQNSSRTRDRRWTAENLVIWIIVTGDYTPV